MLDSYANNLVFIDPQKLVSQRFQELLDWLLQMDTQLQREVFSGVASRLDTIKYFMNHYRILHIKDHQNLVLSNSKFRYFQHF